MASPSLSLGRHNRCVRKDTNTNRCLRTSVQGQLPRPPVGCGGDGGLQMGPSLERSVTLLTLGIILNLHQQLRLRIKGEAQPDRSQCHPNGRMAKPADEAVAEERPYPGGQWKPELPGFLNLGSRRFVAEPALLFGCKLRLLHPRGTARQCCRACLALTRPVNQHVSALGDQQQAGAEKEKHRRGQRRARDAIEWRQIEVGVFKGDDKDRVRSGVRDRGSSGQIGQALPATVVD